MIIGILTVFGFNTQPPEGGWRIKPSFTMSAQAFQHTAARRRLAPNAHRRTANLLFQHKPYQTSFNTQPPEGGWRRSFSESALRSAFQHTAARRRLLKPNLLIDDLCAVSTHSRPKAAGAAARDRWSASSFQHTAARRRLGAVRLPSLSAFLFQHTAARRRLAYISYHLV